MRKARWGRWEDVGVFLSFLSLSVLDQASLIKEIRYIVGIGLSHIKRIKQPKYRAKTVRGKFNLAAFVTARTHKI